MTKAQERARARRRYEKVQAKQARSRRRTLPTRAGGPGCRGRRRRRPGCARPQAVEGRPAPAVNAAGCQAPPTSLGTGAQLTLPDKASAEGKTFTAVLTTNCGDITMELDGTKAPQAVASFVQLANENYWLNAPVTASCAQPR